MALLLPLWGAASAPSAPRSIELELSVRELSGDGWHLEGLVIRLALDPQGQGTGTATVASLALPGLAEPLRTMRLACGDLQIDAAGWRCSQGELQSATSPLGPLGPAAWQGRFAHSGTGEVAVSSMALAGGRLEAQASWSDVGTWNAVIDAQQLAANALWPVLDLAGRQQEWNSQGRADLILRLAGGGGQALQVRLDLKTAGISFASPDGGEAAERLAVTGELVASLDAGAWRGEARLRGGAGQLYIEPLFLDFDEAPLEASCDGQWTPLRQRLACTRWTMAQAGIVQGSGMLELGMVPVRPERLSASLRSERLGALYRAWLQPFVIGSAVDDLELEGRGALGLNLTGGEVQALDLDLEDLSARHRGGLFALEGVRGAVRWRGTAPAFGSRLSLSAGSLYRVAFGPFTTAFAAVGDRVQLEQAVVVPVLDGTLQLNRFDLHGLGGEVGWHAALAFDSLALEDLTATLGWPPFAGAVTGRLPDVTYDGGVLRTGDGLRLRAFDGDVQLNDLTISDPFGAAPTLTGGAELRGLDLAALTQTFSFGRIDGRLNGELRDLELIGWQPNRFRLRLYTPEDSDSPRRISQRAVQNLTELGSGVPAGLSATVLRVFKEFRYDRIEVNVALDGNVAQLAGIPRPDGGYYLVRGAGLPRIDVIGRNRQVAWKDLVQRLRNIRLEGARIE